MDPALLLVPSARFRRLAARLGVPQAELDDVVQDVLIRIWKKQALIQASDHPATYVMRLAVNQIRRSLRRLRGRREIGLEPESVDVPDEQPGPEEQAVTQRRADVLWAIIDHLDPKQREIFIEHELRGRPLAELASASALPVRTVETRLRLAWREVDKAKKRRQATQRRRGEEVVGGFLPWLERTELRHAGWAWRMLGRLSAAAPVGAAVFAIVLAERQSPARPSPLLATRHDAAVDTALVAGVKENAAPLANAATEAPIALPHDNALAARDNESAPISSSPTSREPVPSDEMTEAGLVARARAAIGAHTTAGDMEARALLEQQGRRFPAGRLAGERRVLLARLTQER